MTDSPMTALNKQAELRQLAEKATKGPWRVFSDIGTETYAIHTPRDKRCGNVIKWAGFDCQKNAKANAEFIAAANPATVLALLDELEAKDKRIVELNRANSMLVSKIEPMDRCIAELEAKIETADKLQDSAFRHGLQHGFSYGQTNDQAGYEQCLKSYSSRGKDNG